MFLDVKLRFAAAGAGDGLLIPTFRGKNYFFVSCSKSLYKADAGIDRPAILAFLSAELPPVHAMMRMTSHTLR